ncbi:MAG: DNA-formamidopyrimidine glycosylase family protein [bacterium]
MFELPECLNFARQMNKTLHGKTVARGQLGNSPHKFVWYNRKPAEFEKLTRGKRVGKAVIRGRWLCLPLEPGYVLVIGECGGRILHHPTAADRPAKHHLLLEFEDGSALSVLTQMWGGMELYEAGKELERPYIKDQRVTPDSPRFTYAYFTKLVDSLLEGPKHSVKELLVQHQTIPGLGNSIAQDIMFRARLNPRRSIADLTAAERRRLYDTIVGLVKEVTAKGGRADETDLFGKPGGYVRVMDSSAAGKPCPACGTKVAKISYLGGAAYFCPRCQP